MPIVPVTDPADPRLAPYTAIRERDLTRGHGARFIVEGKVTLETLVRRSRFQPESLFLADNRLSPLEDIVVDVPADLPIYVAPQSLMDKVAGFPVHRGVLACGLKLPPPEMSTLLAHAKTVLLLIGLSNHDNVGACFRNAAAFGADAVLLDETSCDPLYRKSIRVSSGTALTLPFAHGRTAETLFAQLEHNGFHVWCLTPQTYATPIGTLKRPEKLALVLGAEGPGLPKALIDRGTAVRIPMTKGFDSINVATAGAIALSMAYNAGNDRR